MVKIIIIYIQYAWLLVFHKGTSAELIGWSFPGFFLYIFSLTGYLGYRISRIPFSMKIYIIVANMHIWRAQKNTNLIFW